jgi:anti-sigma regulatory factor (Ser/Thr protein kinase)
MESSIAVAIIEPHHVGEARRTALALADRLEFAATERGKVGIVVTEVANNLLQHGSGGTVLLRSLNHRVGIEILGLDQGQGMSDIAACLRDGFSTMGTAGNGLGAIDRLSNQFEIYSVLDQGTAVLSQLWAEPTPINLVLEIGVVCVPKQGEHVSGDAWAVKIAPELSLLLVVDGLGHGAAAAAASIAAVEIFQAQSDQAPTAIVESAHLALRRTRGAVMAIAQLNLETQSVHFVGIGNIAGSIVSADRNRHFVSNNGTVGHEMRNVQEFIYPWAEDGILILHSDGLRTQWQLDRYPGLRQRHPSLIAGVLYRDFHRDRDDVTVLVAKVT